MDANPCPFQPRATAKLSHLHDPLAVLEPTLLSQHTYAIHKQEKDDISTVESSWSDTVLSMIHRRIERAILFVLWLAYSVHSWTMRWQVQSASHQVMILPVTSQRFDGGKQQARAPEKDKYTWSQGMVHILLSGTTWCHGFWDMLEVLESLRLTRRTARAHPAIE